MPIKRSGNQTVRPKSQITHPSSLHASISWIHGMYSKRLNFGVISLLLFCWCDGFLIRHSENGIDVGEIKLVAYVALLKWVEYKPSETHPNAYELVKHWDDKKWVPVAVQSLIRSFMPETRPQFKSVNDVLCAKNVVLFSAKSQYFGEIATIVDSQSLETNGRVCSE